MGSSIAALQGMPGPRTARASPRRSTPKVAERCGKDDACGGIEETRLVKEYVASGEAATVDWTNDHRNTSDHAVKLVGAQHVRPECSDFDGAIMPERPGGIPRSCRRSPRRLLKKGYSSRDIRDILGGNVLRVMETGGGRGEADGARGKGSGWGR